MKTRSSNGIRSSALSQAEPALCSILLLTFWVYVYLLVQMFNPLLGGRRPADTSPRADGKAAASRFDLSTSSLATWSCSVPMFVGSAPLLACRLLLGLCTALPGRRFALNLALADWPSPLALRLL